MLAADIDLLDILNCPDDEEPPIPGPELLHPAVKPDPATSTMATSSQDAASIMPAAVFEGMPEHYGATLFQQEQRLYQPVPEMFGLSCSMHQPMPVVPPEFLPPAVVSSAETVEDDLAATKKAKKEPRRNKKVQ